MVVSQVPVVFWAPLSPQDVLRTLALVSELLLLALEPSRDPAEQRLALEVASVRVVGKAALSESALFGVMFRLVEPAWASRVVSAA